MMITDIMEYGLNRYPATDEKYSEHKQELLDLLNNGWSIVSIDTTAYMCVYHLIQESDE